MRGTFGGDFNLEVWWTDLASIAKLKLSPIFTYNLNL